MNREQAKILAPIINAFGDGEEAQIRLPGGQWHSQENFDWSASPDCYRIKPMPWKIVIAYKDGFAKFHSERDEVPEGFKTITVELPE